jgi:hypothetical protein
VIGSGIGDRDGRGKARRHKDLAERTYGAEDLEDLEVRRLRRFDEGPKSSFR